MKQKFIEIPLSDSFQEIENQSNQIGNKKSEPSSISQIIKKD